MSLQPERALSALLRAPAPDTGLVIDCFILHYNTALNNPSAEFWDISKEEWQRYEFLGDRVLNLLVARMLFERCNPPMSEGEMTKVLSSVVSNQSLDALARRICPEGFGRLIPPSIGEQNSYGERITGGAFEAFVGALFCIAGPDDVSAFLTSLMKEPLERYDPEGNVVGILQESYQQQGMAAPTYVHIASTGPPHKPLHTYRVLTPDGKSFDGEGPNSSEAKQKAARAALDAIRNGIS